MKGEKLDRAQLSKAEGDIHVTLGGVQGRGDKELETKLESKKFKVMYKLFRHLQEIFQDEIALENFRIIREVTTSVGYKRQILTNPYFQRDKDSRPLRQDLCEESDLGQAHPRLKKGDHLRVEILSDSEKQLIVRKTLVKSHTVNKFRLQLAFVTVPLHEPTSQSSAEFLRVTPVNEKNIGVEVEAKKHGSLEWEKLAVLKRALGDYTSTVDVSVKTLAPNSVYKVRMRLVREQPSRVVEIADTDMVYGPYSDTLKLRTKPTQAKATGKRTKQKATRKSKRVKNDIDYNEKTRRGVADAEEEWSDEEEESEKEESEVESDVEGYDDESSTGLKIVQWSERNLGSDIASSKGSRINRFGKSSGADANPPPPMIVTDANAKDGRTRSRSSRERRSYGARTQSSTPDANASGPARAERSARAPRSTSTSSQASSKPPPRSSSASTQRSPRSVANATSSQASGGDASARVPAHADVYVIIDETESILRMCACDKRVIDAILECGHGVCARCCFATTNRCNRCDGSSLTIHKILPVKTMCLMCQEADALPEYLTLPCHHASFCEKCQEKAKFCPHCKLNNEGKWPEKVR